MSMSTHVIGIKPPDDKWRQMKDVWDSCDAAGVNPPESVCVFFGHETPDPKGVVVRLDRTPAVQEYNDGDTCQSGLEVDLSKLPPDVKILRFINSY